MSDKKLWDEYVRMETQNKELRKLLHDIKQWDVSQFLQMPHDLRARIQMEIDRGQ